MSAATATRADHGTTTVVSRLKLTSRHEGMTAGFVFITPDIAAEILALHNQHNRARKESKILEYTRSLNDGLWRVGSTDAIGFDEDENLTNGQNRLQSIVISGVGALMLVIRGVPSETQLVLDTGATRTFGDALRILEVAFPVEVAAVRVVWAYENSGKPAPALLRVSPSHDRLRATFRRHPGIVAVVEENREHLAGYPQSLKHGLWYLFASADPIAAHDFFAQLHSGDGLEATDPILALRERIIKDSKDPEAKGGAYNTLHSAFTIKAFNDWREMRPITRLSSPRDMWAQFPEIDGCTIQVIGDRA